MKEYYVYKMHAVTNALGNPYIGSTYQLNRRANQHKSKFKLDTKPELVIISGPFKTRKEAIKVEQEYKVLNGWPKEGSRTTEVAKKAGKSGGLAALKSGALAKNGSEGGKKMLGKICVNNGIIQTYIYPERLEEFAQQGYVRGRIKRV